MNGTYISSYIMCKTELWYQSHHINLDMFDENMLQGRIIAEESLQNFAHEKRIGDIAIDRINFKDRIIFEIKKSRKSLEKGKYQLLYYLYFLKNKVGCEFKGEIVIPKENYREKVSLNDEIEQQINNMIREIRKIIKLNVPPKPEYKPYCKVCMYYELCWS